MYACIQQLSFQPINCNIVLLLPGWALIRTLEMTPFYCCDEMLSALAIQTFYCYSVYAPLMHSESQQDSLIWTGLTLYTRCSLGQGEWSAGRKWQLMISFWTIMIWVSNSWTTMKWVKIYTLRNQGQIESGMTKGEHRANNTHKFYKFSTNWI